MKKHDTFFWVLVVLAIAVCVALVYFLLPSRAPETPPVLLPTASPAAVSGEDDAAGSGEPGQIAIRPDTVQTVIATLSRASSYSRTLTVEDFWSGGSRKRSIRVWAQNDGLRMDVTAEGSDVTQQILISGGETAIRYSDDPAIYRGSAADGDADAYQTLLTYEALLSAPADRILDADYVDYSGERCVYVRWRSGELGYESECWIQLSTGLLLCERCRDGETLIYAMDSTVPDLSTPDSAVFTLS